MRSMQYAAYVALSLLVGALAFPVAGAKPKAVRDRSPVDLVLTGDGEWLITANETGGSISLVRVESGEVVDEVECGERPAAVVLTPDERRVLVSASYSGELRAFELGDGELNPAGSVYLGFEPRGIAVSPDGRVAYVALTTAHAVAVVDLERLEEVERIAVGRWPRYLALAPDGNRLAVGTSGDQGVSVVDTAERKMLFLNKFRGLNLGQMHVSANGRYAYVPWMIYRNSAITAAHIRQGWVLGSRIARIRLDANARREAITLDKRGEAVSDPHGLALSPDEQWMVCAASGTHELLVFRMEGLPWEDYGGPGDHIDNRLVNDRDRFYRIPMGGRPMALRFGRDGRVYVANYLRNSVQVVDLGARKVEREISLGGPAEPSLVRRGEEIFYDGRRSLDQWYSCHSCHYEGHTNAVTMDTRNDGTNGSFKTVLSLRNVTRTGPWTWHGWQEDLEAAMHKSITETMLGPEPTGEDVKALIAYLETLRPPPNPHRGGDGGLSEAAQRGKAVFESAKAGCARCHAGPYFTDDVVHDVGLGKASDVYAGFNPPSLVAVYDRMRYLHDGSAASLEKVLRGAHNPAGVTGRGELSEAELADLIEYLKSL